MPYVAIGGLKFGTYIPVAGDDVSSYLQHASPDSIKNLEGAGLIKLVGPDEAAELAEGARIDRLRGARIDLEIAHKKASAHAKASAGALASLKANIEKLETAQAAAKAELDAAEMALLEFDEANPEAAPAIEPPSAPMPAAAKKAEEKKAEALEAEARKLFDELVVFNRDELNEKGIEIPVGANKRAALAAYCEAKAEEGLPEFEDDEGIEDDAEAIETEESSSLLEELGPMTKAELVEFAYDRYDLELKSSLRADEMREAILEAAGE